MHFCMKLGHRCDKCALHVMSMSMYLCMKLGHKCDKCALHVMSIYALLYEIRTQVW